MLAAFEHGPFILSFRDIYEVQKAKKNLGDLQ